MIVTRNVRFFFFIDNGNAADGRRRCYRFGVSVRETEPLMNKIERRKR